MKIEGEVKAKVYSVIADSIDVLRLYQSAVVQVEALADENARLKDRCDMLERYNSQAGPDPEGDQRNANLARKLWEMDRELNRYKAFPRVFERWLSSCEKRYASALREIIQNKMKEEGYDIETEEHRIEGFGSSGSKDNTEGKDEHNFL